MVDAPLWVVMLAQSGASSSLVRAADLVGSLFASRPVVQSALPSIAPLAIPSASAVVSVRGVALSRYIIPLGFLTCSSLCSPSLHRVPRLWNTIGPFRVCLFASPPFWGFPFQCVNLIDQDESYLAGAEGSVYLLPEGGRHPRPLAGRGEP